MSLQAAVHLGHMPWALTKEEEEEEEEEEEDTKYYRGPRNSTILWNGLGNRK
jgi:hypothetical protein